MFLEMDARGFAVDSREEKHGDNNIKTGRIKIDEKNYCLNCFHFSAQYIQVIRSLSSGENVITNSLGSLSIPQKGHVNNPILSHHFIYIKSYFEKFSLFRI